MVYNIDTMSELLTTVGLITAPIALIPISMVNPLGKGADHKYKIAIIFGLIPSLIKMVASSGYARVSTRLILGAFLATYVVHLLLRYSDKYRKSIDTPSKVKAVEAIMSWSGIVIFYAVFLLFGVMMLGQSAYENAGQATAASTSF